MTHYRPSTAITHWRHLTVIATEANVNGTPVAAEDVTEEMLDSLIETCHRFTKRINAYSLGRCWIQHDVYVYPEEWTAGAVRALGGYIVGANEVEATCDPMGVRAAGYDTLSFMGPAPTLNTGANGLTYANSGTGTYHNFIEYGLDWTDFHASLEDWILFQTSVMTHEFAHSVGFYYGDYGLSEHMAHADFSNLYEHLDGTPLNNNSTDPPHDDFALSFYSGNMRDIDDEEPSGCREEIWALGPPRKNYPR